MTHTHTHLFNGPLSRTTQVSQYQKGKTNLDFTEKRENERQWHLLGYMQVCPRSVTMPAPLLFLFFSRPRSEGWPLHGRTFSIYPCPLSF